MLADLAPHALAIASVIVLAVGLLLMIQGTAAIQRLRIPEDADDEAGFALADRLLEKGRTYLRTGEVIAVVGGIGGIVAALGYAGVIPGL